ncbi:PPC domain-containing protein [Rosistilla oblonga]|uniref:PPC domain-containing protein n=1 Tax=Rosistilla oblonga TaxID=2527990 RepID=UPI003A983CA1
MRTLALILAASQSLSALAAPPKMDSLFPAGAGREATRTVTAAGTFSNWPPQVWVDREGLTVTPAKDKGKLEIAAGADAAGVYFIRLFDAEGASDVRPFLVDSLPAVDEVEPNNTPEQAQPIDGNAVVDGVLHKTGEVDRFAIPMKKGQTLVASLQAHNRLGSPMDAVLQVADPRGFVVAQNDDNVGNDPQIVFEAPADGTYSVSLFAFPATPNSTINFSGSKSYIYRLTLTTAGFVDHCSPMAIDTETDSAIQLHGWNIPDTAASVTPSAIPGERQFVAHPELASFVEVVRSSIPVFDPATHTEGAPIAWPVVISDQISAAGEVDKFALDAKKGQTLRCRVESDSLGYLLDPVVTLFDEKGKQLAEVDDSSGRRDSELRHTIPADGRYELAVRDLYGNGGPRFAYRMTIDDSPPGFALTVAADSFVVKGKEKLTLPIAVARERGCSDEIAISIEGLPETLTATTATSAAKGATAKEVKLEISVSGEESLAFSGPIRIVGRIAGDKPRELAATFTVAGTEQTLDQIWLTAVKP